MRTRLFAMVAALLLVSAGAMAQDNKGADGQQDVPKATAPSVPELGFVNQIDFGIRGTGFSANSDEARYQRFQDRRDGATLDRFRFTKDTSSYVINLQADNVGYKDQRFSASYNNYGKVKASFEWNEVPLFYSQTTQSLYSSSTPGVLTLPASIQSGIQNKTLTLPTAMLGAGAFSMQTERKVADFRMAYSASSAMNLNVTFKNTQRDGSQPYTAGFGFSGATDEFALPINQRTTEFGTNLEYGSAAAYLKLAYDGSFFRDNISTLTWANPLRSTDSSTAPANGRLAMAPNTDSNTVSASAGFNQLPGRSHANAYISVGSLSNNDPLMPFTINSAIASPALSRANADVQARVTAMNFSFTSRPLDPVWLNVRYRQYEFDNRTAPFIVGQTVGYDSSLTTANTESEPLGYTRHTLDADVSFTPITYLGLRAGYTHEQIDRTFRWVESSKEDVARASIDLAGISWLSVRGVYEYSKRAAVTSIDPAEILAIGEQPTLGQYDIAPRNRNRFSTIVTITPVSMFSVNGSAGVGRDDYPSSYFGLRSYDSDIYSVGFDFVPVENKVTIGASYGYEKYNGLQASRYAAHVTTGVPPTFNNPLYDWLDTNTDRVDTINASIEMKKIIPNFDITVGYDYSGGNSNYVYTLPNGPQTSPAVLAAPNPLAPVTNKLNRGTVDTRYFFTKRLAIGLVYWYDSYSVNDFALGPQTGGLAIPVANPSIMMLGYNWRPYTANTVMGRFTYLW